jgi:hypothetical protein
MTAAPTVTVPPWLAQRNGSLRPAVDGRSVVVTIDNEPQYVVTPVPAKGKHGSRVMQTINGKIIPSSGTFATAEEAIRGGLEDLRKALGW